MKEFLEVPAGKESMVRRRPVYGMGINDADYEISRGNNICPFYRKWVNMLERCYCETYQQKQPTYKGCKVCDEWLIFSNFKAWMKNQDWKDKELDKDILIPGNKIYSSVTCVFVPRRVNGLLVDCGGRRGKFPLGVSFHKYSGRFRAYCNVNGKIKHVGYYDSSEDATDAANIAKSDEIKRVAYLQTDPRVTDGLLRHAQLRLNA